MRLKADGTPDQRNPPSSTRYRKGASGNPLGRPRATFLSLSQQAKEIAEEPVAVIERGVRKKLTERQISARRLAHDMAKGDLKAFKEFVRVLKRDNKTASKFQAIQIRVHPDPD